jgi:hypothetical protein
MECHFPPDLWPTDEEETEDGGIVLKLKDGTRLPGLRKLILEANG